MLSSIDTVITENIKYIEKGLPFYARFIPKFKNASKTMVLNISDSNLNANDMLILGGLQIGFGIATELAVGTLASTGFIAGCWTLVVSIGASLAFTYFITEIYIYCKENAPQLWESLKQRFDESSKYIATIIENNISSLQDFTSNVIDKITAWIDEFDVNDLIIQGNHSNGEIQYNSAHPYANPQRNLDSKDYQSIIEVLLHTDSNANDIDKTLRSFNNYLKKSDADSNTNATDDSTINASNHSTQTTTNSPNPHPPTNNTTIPFKLIIKDYDLLIPLKDKEIQITNIDAKKCYESKFTTRNGEVIFEIPSNERGDFFSIKLINDSDYEQSPYYLAKETYSSHAFSLEHYNQTPTNKLNSKSTQYYEFKNSTNKILSPNNYQKCSATLYFKAKIYLYFNGFTLFVMQGDKVRASYEGHTKARIENGTYFINTQEAQSLLKESNIAAQNNADFAKSNSTLSLYNDKEFTQTHCKICDNTQETLDNNIYLKHFFANIKNIAKLINTMPYVKCIIDYKINLIKNIKIEGHNDRVFVNLNAPFAIGTYLTLKAIKFSDESNIGTIYWKEELYAKKHKAKNFELISHNLRKEFIIGQDTQDFYLSTPKELDHLRQNGYVEFIYLIYASNIKQFDKNTAHIKFNLTFAVGNDGNVSKSQRANNNTKQEAIYAKAINSNDINEWNKLDYIYSIDEALWFLKANDKNLDEFYKSNRTTYNKRADAVFDYFKTYPQLAGKIAYIYYSFDLGDENFIDSVEQTCYVWFECKDEYKDDRDNFINSVVKVYKGISFCDSTINISIICNVINSNTRNYKQEFENAFLRGNANWKQLITDFLYDVCDELGIKQQYRPKIDTEPNPGDSGTYRRKTNTISIKPPNNIKDSFIIFIDTIIHEFRHFYIWYVFEDAQGHKLAQSRVAKLIYYNDTFYIAWSYDKFFNAYDKECAIFDAELKKCHKNHKYSKNIIKINKQFMKPSPLYYIQPNERDTKVVAWKFRQKVGVK
ncbi:hypothetical protein DMC01_05520 [Campylobacter troglodytis]|nr:hypothetical protein DMC01_05520 [Campylobacter troglodytis]